MADELRVSFIFDDKDGPKIDAINRKLTETNAQLNSLTADRAAAEFSKLTNAGQKSIDHMREFSRAFSQETGKTATDLSALQSRVEKTKFAFSDLAAQNLKAGNFGHLANEIATARDRSRQLEMDIKSIKAELANPNRQSSIKFLMQELQAAEREADSLGRKLAIVQGRSAGAGAGGGFFGNNLTSHEYYSRINLARQGADVFTMAGMGASPQMIAITQGPQIIDAMATSGIKFSGAMVASAAAIGVIAAAGYGVVQWTKNARTEAEKRLKTETMITAEFNKQNLARKQAIQDLRDAEAEQKFGRQFARDLKNLDDDALRRRQETIRQLINLNPTGPFAERNERSILAINDELARRAEERTKKADEAFFQRNENFKKYQNSVVALEQKSQAETRAAIEKVKELGKAYEDVFATLSQKTNANNPLVSVFLESRSELEKLRESIKGLPKEMQTAAVQMQRLINSRRLFEAQIDNRLSVFGLREDAANFRNPFDPERLRVEQERFIQDFLRRNPNYLFLQRAEFEGRARETGYPNLESFEDFVRRDILKRGTFDTPQTRLNKSLEDRFSQIYGTDPRFLTPDQLSIANRRFISATQGIDPLQLNDLNRERAALAREQEANREAQFQSDLLKVQGEMNGYLRSIAETQARFLEVAKREGLEGLNNLLITVKDETGGGISTGRSGNSADVAAYYQQGGLFAGTNR